MIQHKDPHSADHLQANTNRTTDALIAMDQEGIVKSWNHAHELNYSDKLYAREMSEKVVTIHEPDKKD